MFQRTLFPVIVFCLSFGVAVPASSQCLWYPDNDGDGFGASVVGTPGPCQTVPPGFVSNRLDCNDNSTNIAEWAAVGGPTIGSGIVLLTKIRIAPDGTPYVLYRWYTDPDPTSLISVRKFNGSAWVPVGGDPIAISDHMVNPDLAIDATGVPYVSFVDQEQGDRVTVIRYDAIGNTWNVLGSRGFSADAVIPNGMVSLAIDNNNVPYVFYSSPASEGFVMRYDQVSSSWQDVGTGPIASLGSSEYGIALDKNNIPYVVFTESDTEISVMRFTGGSWQVVGTRSFSDNYISLPQIVLDDTNIPYVAYFDEGSLELVVQRYDATGANWVKVGGPVYNDYTELSLAIDKLGAPHIAYNGTGNISVKRWTGTSWQFVANNEFATGLSISLAIAPDNVPYVSCKDLVNSDFASVRMVTPAVSPPSAPTLASTKTSICSGETTRLTISSGNLHDATAWKWYAAGCGTGASLGSGLTLDVSPTTNTTYYARGEGNCAPVGSCGQITISVTTTPTTPTLAATKSSVCPGGSTTLSIATGTLGDAATQQWVWYETTCGAAASRLGNGTTLIVTPSVTTTYYARGEGSCQGSCASIIIQVIDLPVATGPAAASSICSGSTGTLTVTPVSNVASYLWRVSDGAGSWIDIPSQTSATLSRAAADLQTYPTENVYSVLLKNSIGCEQTISALKILSFPQPAIGAAGSPINAVICAGGNTSFNVAMSSGVNLDYQWQVDNGGGGGFVNVANGSGYADATTPNLKINGAGTLLNSHAYRVVVRTLSAGSPVCTAVTSAGATLTVNTAPSLNAAGQPINTTLCSAGTANFSVTPGGTNLTYQWQESNGGAFTDISNAGIYSGATTANLRITGTTAGMDGYSYRVVVGNASCSAVTSSATTLSVNTPPTIGAAAQPSSTSLCSGSDATFNVTPGGTNLSYQWQESSGAAFSDIIDNSVYSGATTSSLRITGVVNALDDRKYRVVVSNTGCSPATSNGTATLGVINRDVTIAQQPSNTAVCASGNTSFEVTATGTDLAYQWQERAGAAFTDITDNALYAGATTTTLTITGTTESMDGREYRVVVRNESCGTSATSDGLATLTIATSGISITEDPSDITICQGDDAGFQVTVVGTGLTYQWQESIAGDSFEDITDTGVYEGTTTNSLVVKATAGMNGYRYRVAISNGGCQTIMSEASTLSVNTEPGAAGCPYVLLVSEGLSPNGDNQLDYWVIQGIERYPDNSVKVYNVWGDLIFEQRGYANEAQPWRGESNRGARLTGSMAPDGTYYYTINLGDDRGSNSILKGFVLLKR